MWVVLLGVGLWLSMKFDLVMSMVLLLLNLLMCSLGFCRLVRIVVGWLNCFFML